MKYFSVAMVSAVLLGSVAPVQAQQMSEVAPSYIAQGSDVGAIAQAFIQELASGDFTGAFRSYDSPIRSTISPDSLAQQWQDITAVSGAYQGAANVSVDTSSGTPIAIVTGQFENGSRDLFILFNENNEIVSMDIVQ